MKKQFSIVKILPIYGLLFVFLLMISVGGSRAVTVLRENAPITGRKVIVIDAGHGGVDGGATSCTGILESNINLQISLRLNDLMHLLGVDTVMIRTTDRSVHTSGNTIAQKKISDLKERVRIVNSYENALLLSIHQNYYTQEQYYGPQVFFGRKEGNRELAKTMQQYLTASLCPESKRQTKSSDGVYLMENVQCEALLIECGFISNYEEAVKLTDPAYQKKLCCVITAVCGNYLREGRLT